MAVWSHLAHADTPGHPMLDVQAARLNAAWRAAVDRGLAPIRHLANAAATLTRPDLHFDLVRPGIAVYGLDPLGRPVGQSPLRPAMTLRRAGGAGQAGRRPVRASPTGTSGRLRRTPRSRSSRSGTPTVCHGD